ncbi:uncharacterized protein LOC123217566 isoform X3 [Mangifera indica]|uniref:uncharacterized protein LOC123217566 isoform X3 n=1 Tax=Mangifera indica TaxID=29780 RepID=UPI001CFAA2AF|nr:uncharacterized protein LOC123217566 isoform X3 [Mangifera indica]
MNFLLRSASSTQHAVPEQESPAATSFLPKPRTTLENLIAEDTYPRYSTADDRDGGTESFEIQNGGSIEGFSENNDSRAVENHTDVSEEEGWITIPCKELPDNWYDAPDIHSLCSLDRSFVFPGEQVHVLACLLACKQDTEIITPFKVAAVMSRGRGQSPEKKKGNNENIMNSVAVDREASPDRQVTNRNDENSAEKKMDLQKDILASASLLRMEDHKRQTETLLQKFKDSHFFVRIAESGIDRQNFDANACGGVARNLVKCCSLSNGDIVVLLQVNVGVDFLRDPIIEILQFEKNGDQKLYSEKVDDNSMNAKSDPCGELLKWLLPLGKTVPSPARSLPRPAMGPATGIGSSHHKSSSSGPQLLSHLRSYSMSSLPQNTTPTVPVNAQRSNRSFDFDDWDKFSSQKLTKDQRNKTEGLLSFRGVSMEQERFAVRCGLEGIYAPGRRWRRKLEIIQPVEIHSFGVDCNTDDLLCVQIKNVSPAHTPDIVIYIDTITIVFEEAAKCGPSSSLPIACIEAGNDHSLPNLPLRRGEEHSFILRPASSLWTDHKSYGEKSSRLSSLHLPSKTSEGKMSASTADHFAIMVSCRCNYTESRLFFKQPTTWRPRISRDLMISVASEMSRHFSELNDRITQLPVKVLTLQASNLTSKDLTLTVLAPTSSASPTVVSLNAYPSSPLSPFLGFSEFAGKVNDERCGNAPHELSSAPLASENLKQNGDGGVWSMLLDKQSSTVSDVIPNTGLGCTHLWLQSRIPLGCVPSHSTATIKLELLPLTDGIITLDTLQIDVKEKGTYLIISLLLFFCSFANLPETVIGRNVLSVPSMQRNASHYFYGFTEN